MSVNNNHIVKLGQLKKFAQDGVLPIKQSIDTHAASLITSETGVHGLRYYDDVLEVNLDDFESVTPESGDNPSEEGWYEFVNNEYILSEDTSVSSGKTYYRAIKEWVELDTGGGVKKTKVIIPTIAGLTNFTYDGTLKELTVSGLNETYVTATGLSATNAGTYTATFALKDTETTMWTDRTIVDRTVEWEIVKAEGSATLSKNTVSLNANIQSDVVTVLNPTGIVSVSSSDATVATASYSNGTITISSPSEKMGTATITVNIAASTNYNATSYSISVAFCVIIPTASGSTTFTYDGTQKQLSVSGLDTTYITATNLTATNVGSYTATFSLKDTATTTWTDGTTTDKTISWSITKANITIPTASGSTSFTYDGTEKELSISGLNTTYVTATYTTATNVGTYTATFILKDTTNTTWSDNSITNKTISWSITKASITIPTASGMTSFTYDGTLKELLVSGLNTTYVTATNLTGTNVGTYTATFSLKDTDNTMWSDESITNKTISWEIEKITVTIPTASGATAFTYDGTQKELSVSGLNTTYVTATNLTGTNVGIYTATFSLKDTTITMWTDGTIADKTISWEIGNTIVTIPTVSGSTTFTYDGTLKSLTLSGLDTTYVTATNTSATNAGTYTATFSLIDASNSKWADSTTTDKTISWEISKANGSATLSKNTVSLNENSLSDTVSVTNATGTISVSSSDTSVATVSYSNGTITISSSDGSPGTATITVSVAADSNHNATSYSITVTVAVVIPTVSGTTTFTYDGTQKGITVSGLNTTYVTATYLTATNAGTYTATFALRDTSYMVWTDGTTANKTVSWEIEKASITIPAASGSTSFTYDGTQKQISVTGLNTTYVTATNLTGTNADTYTATFSLKDVSNTIWSDSTTADKTISWSIAKASGSATLSKNSVELNSNTLTDTVTITDATGDVSVSSSDTNIATASYSNGTITITSPDENTGTAVITVTIASSLNYESASYTINITASFSMIYGVEWDGSSTTAWSRTDAATDFTNPVPAVNNGNGSSPFDDIMPWSGMKRVTDATGGVLVEIPKFWYKWTRSGSTMKLQISNGYAEGFLVSPGHADRGDGKGERDKIYVGAYHCDSSYKSSNGVKPITSITRSAARTGIHNLGADYWQWDYATLWTIRILYLVEYADWNSQKVIGYGCGNNSSTENAGACDSMVYHTGTNASNRTTYGHTRYRYIEDLWGNVYDWCDGIYFSSSNIYCIKNPANFSDSANGTNVGTRTTSSNCIKVWTNPTASGFEYALYPSEVVSDSNYSTYVADHCGYVSSGVVLHVGGYYVQYQGHGLFYMYGYSAASYSYGSIGSRLQKLP